MTYRERRARRAERREQWAASRDRKSEASFSQADKIASGIPLGQPILVGHHSERRARKDAERIDNGMRRGVEHAKMAEHHRAKADGIRAQLDRSVYDDDTDACERLEARIAEREAQRDRIKAINKEAGRACRSAGLRRHGNWLMSMAEDQRAKVAKAITAVCEAVQATPAEREAMLAALEMNGAIGYPPYALTNLGANIRRDTERLERLRTR